MLSEYENKHTYSQHIQMYAGTLDMYKREEEKKQKSTKNRIDYCVF